MTVLRLFREYYAEERYKLVAYWGNEISIRDKTLRANVLVASFLALKRMARRVFFNLFRRRRAMRQFEQELIGIDVSGSYTTDKTVKVSVSCKNIMTPEEAQLVLDESKTAPAPNVDKHYQAVKPRG